MGEWTQERHDKAIKRIAEKPYNDMGLICDNARDFLDVLPEIIRLTDRLAASENLLREVLSYLPSTGANSFRIILTNGSLRQAQELRQRIEGIVNG